MKVVFQIQIHLIGAFDYHGIQVYFGSIIQMFFTIFYKYSLNLSY